MNNLCECQQKTMLGRAVAGGVGAGGGGGGAGIGKGVARPKKI